MILNDEVVYNIFKLVQSVHSALLTVAFHSLSSGRAPCVFSFPCWHVYWGCHFLGLDQAAIWVRHHWYSFSVISRRHSLTTDSWSCGLYSLSSMVFLEPSVHLYDGYWDWIPTLRSAGLCMVTTCDFSQVVSVCYKEKFPWWEIRARLSVVSGEIYNAVRNPGDVVRWRGKVLKDLWPH